MLSVEGIYENGQVILNKKLEAIKPVRVIVTFLEDLENMEIKKVDLNKFSFDKSREVLKDYKGSLSEAIIEERRISH